MKKRLGLVALCGIALIVLGCSSPEQGPPPLKTLTTSSLSEMLKSDTPPRIIDTRSPLEWRDTQIFSSQSAPCDEPETVETLLTEARQTPLVLYGNGNIDRESCPLLERLVKAGKPSVFVLSGGLMAWKRNGYPTISVDRIPRLAVPGIAAAELPSAGKNGKKKLILDIRSAAAFAERPIPDALNIPLSRLHEKYGDIPLDRSVIVVDEDGSRSLLAASFLLRKGVSVAARLRGGFKALSILPRKGGKQS